MTKETRNTRVAGREARGLLSVDGNVVGYVAKGVASSQTAMRPLRELRTARPGWFFACPLLDDQSGKTVVHSPPNLGSNTPQ